jgi:hypothetical protein
MSDPFAALIPNTNPYGGISDMLSGMFGGSGGGGGGGGFSEDALNQLRMEEIQSKMGLDERMGAAYDRMGQAPSKWATGAQTFGSIAQGLSGLGNIYLGLQGLKQQKKAFEFNKGVVNTNLNNSISDYNRRLNDTLQNRALNNGGGQAYVSQQMSQWQAKRS